MAQNVPATEASLFGDIKFGEVKGGRLAMRNVASQLRGASIAELSRDLIMRFPIHASSAISDEDVAVLSAALEKQYAAFALLTVSSMINIDNTKYSSTQDLVRDIHKNEDSPRLFDYVFGLLANANAAGLVESASAPVLHMSEDERHAMWYGADDEVNMESLNSKYLPNNSVIDKLTSVLEASSKNSKKSKPQNPKQPPDVSDTQELINIGKNMGNTRWGDKLPDSKAITKMPQIQENKNLSALPPTIINGQVYINGAPRNLAIGVKTMVRSVPTNVMVLNLVDGVQDNRFSFQLIKWTNGERKFFRDFIFGITQSREDALNSKSSKSWASALRWRKKNAKTFIGGGRPISPIATVICTEYEVESVKAQTGVDLHNPESAKKLMKDLYLLGFMIYNPSTGVVETMLDGDATGGQFATSTLAAIKIHGSSGDTSIKDINQLLKNMGRF